MTGGKKRLFFHIENAIRLWYSQSTERPGGKVMDARGSADHRQMLLGDRSMVGQRTLTP
jgi:hypothetical protein